MSLPEVGTVVLGSSPTGTAPALEQKQLPELKRYLTFPGILALDGTPGNDSQEAIYG